MQKRVLLIGWFAVFSLVLQAQNNMLFWERLKNINTESVQITPGPEFPAISFGYDLRGNYGLPLKDGHNIYCWIGGTGRLYKMYSDSLTGKSFFKRIDSTEAILYNIGALPFVYKKRIYTLGGAGIWRINGQLRIFNEQAKEWDIVKLNKEVPFMWGVDVGCVWYDPEKGRIFVGYTMPLNEALKDEYKPLTDVYELDLETKEWKQLGTLNNNLVSKIKNFKNYAMSPKGLLGHIEGTFYFFNFFENRIYRLRDNIPYRQSLLRWFGSTFYFQDSVLYVHNSTKNIFDSVRMKSADFETETIPVYTKAGSSYLYFYFFIPLILGVTAFLVLRKRKQFQKVNEQITEKGITTEPVELSAVEFNVLQLIFSNSTGSKNTTIEELNTLMGLTRKNVDIQKKQRSDMLIALNRKLSNLSENGKVVIDKVRSVTDKRVFEYYIDSTFFDHVHSILTTHSFEK